MKKIILSIVLMLGGLVAITNPSLAQTSTYTGTVYVKGSIDAQYDGVDFSNVSAAIVGKSSTVNGLFGSAVSDFTAGIVGDGSLGWNTAGVIGKSWKGPFGVGVSASATSGLAIGLDAYDGGYKGATAVRVRGSMIKDRTPGNRIRVYNPVTGAFVGEFEFEIVQSP